MAEREEKNSRGIGGGGGGEGGLAMEAATECVEGRGRRGTWRWVGGVHV